MIDVPNVKQIYREEDLLDAEAVGPYAFIKEHPLSYAKLPSGQMGYSYSRVFDVDPDDYEGDAMSMLVYNKLVVLDDGKEVNLPSIDVCFGSAVFTQTYFEDDGEYEALDDFKYLAESFNECATKEEAEDLTEDYGLEIE